MRYEYRVEYRRTSGAIWRVDVPNRKAAQCQFDELENDELMRYARIERREVGPWKRVRAARWTRSDK